MTSRSPERAPRPPRPPSFLDAKRAREPSPCPRTPSPRPRRTPVDARLALLDEITRPETPPPEASTPQAKAPSAADGGSPSTSAVPANTNAALRALLKQKDAQIAALKAQLVGPAPRRPPVPQTTPPKTPSGNVSIARQSPRKRHGALLGQIRDILHLAHAPRPAGAAAPAPADAVWRETDGWGVASAGGDPCLLRLLLAGGLSAARAGRSPARRAAAPGDRGRRRRPAWAAAAAQAVRRRRPSTPRGAAACHRASAARGAPRQLLLVWSGHDVYRAGRPSRAHVDLEHGLDVARH